MRQELTILLLVALIIVAKYAKTDEFCKNACKNMASPIACISKCEDDCWMAAETKMYQCFEKHGQKYCMFDFCQQVKICNKTTNQRFVPFQDHCQHTQK